MRKWLRTGLSDLLRAEVVAGDMMAAVGRGHVLGSGGEVPRLSNKLGELPVLIRVLNAVFGFAGDE